MAVNVRVVRRLAGLLLVVGLVYVGWLLAHMKKRPSAAVKEQQATAGSVPKAPEQESGCFDDLVVEAAGYRLEAGRACKQPDGYSQLQRVALHLRRDDGGERMTVTADRGRTAESPGQPIELSGHVRVQTPDGLLVETESLVVDKSNDVVTTEVPVTFNQGDLSGSGRGLRHDWKNGRTVLLGDPVLDIAGERTRGRTITLTGETIEYEGSTHRLTSRGDGKLEFPDAAIAGSTVEVLLTDEAEDVRLITATGGAATRVVGAAGGPTGGGPILERILRADRIDHAFAAGSTLERVEATGLVRLDGRPVRTDSGLGEVLEGQRVVLVFRPGGGPSALDSVTAEGTPARFVRTDGAARREVVGAELALRAGESGFDRLSVRGAASVRDEAVSGTRSLVADEADIGLDPKGSSLRSLAFEGSPGRLRDVGPAGAMRRSVTAQRADLRFDSAGNPVAGTLDGEVELTGPDGVAKADHATLEDAPRRTILTGRASVEQRGSVSHGDEIVRDEVARTLQVRGNQHTLVRDASGIPGMASTDSDEPIVISSDALILDEAARRAQYEGGRVMLRRGDTELMSDRLVLDDVAATMDAWGKIESRLRLARPGEATPAPDAPFDPTRLVDGRAEEFHYLRGERLVSYVGDVTLKQEETVLTAQRVDIRLTGAEPAQVESLTALGDAFFRAPTRGEAEGERLRMIVADGSVRVHGGVRPARARDIQGNFQTGDVVEMTRDGVRAVASPAGRTRGSSPALKAPEP